MIGRVGGAHGPESAPLGGSGEGWGIRRRGKVSGRSAPVHERLGPARPGGATDRATDRHCTLEREPFVGEPRNHAESRCAARLMSRSHVRTTPSMHMGACHHVLMTHAEPRILKGKWFCPRGAPAVMCATCSPDARIRVLIGANRAESDRIGLRASRLKLGHGPG